MPTKKEILQEIEDSQIKSYTKEIVKSLVNRIKVERDKPSYLKVGDIFLCEVNGLKRRPVVIIAIKHGVVYGIPLSTTEDSMNMMPSKSRFTGDGWFGKSLVTLKEADAMEYFAGTYDNDRLVRKARLELKKLLTEVL